MKKRVLRALSAIMSAALIFSLSGCGPLGNIIGSISSKPTPAPSPTPAPILENAPTPTPQPASGKYATVRDYLEDNRESIEKDVSGSDVYSFTLDATNDRLIFNYVITQESIDSVGEAMLVSSLEETVSDESFVSIFQSVAESVQDSVDVPMVKIDLIYSRLDGTELVHRVYAAGGDITSAADLSGSTGDASSSGSSGLYATVRDFVNDPSVQAEINRAIEGIEGTEGLSISVESTDDTLTYLFTYDEATLALVDIDDLKADLEESMSSEDFESAYEEIAENVASLVEISPIKVQVVYANSNGMMIAGREFTTE